jgi:amino acid adenylation domain-containing protein
MIPIFEAFDNGAIEQSIPSRFEQQVARYPDRIAVVSGETRLTYTELNQAANRIAHIILARLGSGDETVALLFQPGASIIAATLGALKAGKISVALDPSYPQARTAYMLVDCEARLLLTDSKHLSMARQLAQNGQEVFDCDATDASVAAGNLDVSLSGETAAIILYTSGSTGNPKGVLHNHRNVLVEVRNYTNDVRIRPEDRLAVWHSFSFANSIRNLYGALLNGATVFPYDLPGQGLMPLADWIWKNEITMIHTLATTFRAFVDTVSADTTFPSLRVLRLGGEPINGSDVRSFQRHFSSHCILMHVMGPTETFSIRRHFIGHDWDGDKAKLPVGYAVPDKGVFLLDETGRRVAPDEIGEIAVQSKYLAVGYWRQPQLTRATFIPDPKGGEERLYLTGDLGVMRPDGCLIHMGRKDFQVKIRGHRIEVGEIETALSEFDSVKAAVVQAQPDANGEQRLVAYIVAASGSVVTVSELRRGLAQTLPDFMMPSNFVFLEDFPLLPNGKVNRRALPVPTPARPVLPVPYAMPRNPIESTLVAIWMEVLSLEKVGIHDRFLDLGGDSLRATRVLNRARDSFTVKLSISDLLKTESIAQLADLICLLQAGVRVEPPEPRAAQETEGLEAHGEVGPSASVISPGRPGGYRNDDVIQ